MPLQILGTDQMPVFHLNSFVNRMKRKDHTSVMVILGQGHKMVSSDDIQGSLTEGLWIPVYQHCILYGSEVTSRCTDRWMCHKVSFKGHFSTPLWYKVPCFMTFHYLTAERSPQILKGSNKNSSKLLLIISMSSADDPYKGPSRVIR